VLTHVRFEAYGAVHWGQRNGEFRFGIDSGALGTIAPAVQDLANKLTAPRTLSTWAWGFASRFSFSRDRT
jgi:hypothetical protein